MFTEPKFQIEKSIFFIFLLIMGDRLDIMPLRTPVFLYKSDQGS